MRINQSVLRMIKKEMLLLSASKSHKNDTHEKKLRRIRKAFFM